VAEARGVQLKRHGADLSRFPEEVFQKIGQDPATLKDLGDIPGPPPVYYRVFSPPPGTTIQRGIVPGGEFGGRGGVPGVFSLEDF
jgi:hypothetical protein